jgi:hypothetical protein
VGSARLLLLTAAVVLAQVAATAASPVPRVTYTDVPGHQVAMVEWGIALFDEAGLTLPPIEVHGHRGTETCGGRPGLHRWIDGRSRIDLCTRFSRSSQELLVLHELAHAWDRVSLTPARREAFLELRGLTDWRHEDLDHWADLGAEHAAEIVMWGLADRPVRVVRIDGGSCAELLAGYRLLTGDEPLHGSTVACAADEVR